MMTTPASATPRWQRSRIARLCLAVVVTVPMVYAALYMWMIWDPTNTVDQMPVALVNADQPAMQGSTTISAGAEVSQNLMAADALDFHQVSAEQAASGVADGSYYFAIEIPRDFSRTLADIGSTTVAPALISVKYNDYNTLMASNIGARAISAIYTAVLQGVSSSTVGTVLTGVDSLGDGLRSAASGAAEVHDGTTRVAAGADSLADGVSNQLAPGAADAARGGTQVAAGASEVAAGATRLRIGTDTLGAGATRVADGIDELVSTADVPALQDKLKQLRALLPRTGTEQITGGLDQVAALLTGLQQLQSGSQQIATQLTDPSAAYRGGLDRLVDGSDRLSTGADELASGLGRLSAGTERSATGALELQRGARQLDTGAATLAAGLSTGAAKIPELGDQARQKSLASLLSTPVTTRSTNTAPAQFSGPGGAPALLIIAAALIPLVVLMSFRAHRFVTAGSAPRSTRVAVRRFLTVTAVSLIAMAIVGPILWNILSPSPTPASLPQVVAIAAAATVMNVALATLLFTLFGYVAGALTSLAAMMLQVFSYGGVWMVETLPAPLRWLHPIAPMTYVRDGFIAGFNGVSGFTTAFVVIALITSAATIAGLGIYQAGRARYLRTESEHVPQQLADARLAR